MLMGIGSEDPDVGAEMAAASGSASGGPFVVDEFTSADATLGVSAPPEASCGTFQQLAHRLVSVRIIYLSAVLVAVPLRSRQPSRLCLPEESSAMTS